MMQLDTRLQMQGILYIIEQLLVLIHIQMMVRDFQAVIGYEARKQILEKRKAA